MNWAAMREALRQVAAEVFRNYHRAHHDLITEENLPINALIEKLKETALSTCLDTDTNLIERIARFSQEKWERYVENTYAEEAAPYLKPVLLKSALCIAGLPLGAEIGTAHTQAIIAQLTHRLVSMGVTSLDEVGNHLRDPQGGSLPPKYEDILALVDRTAAVHAIPYHFEDIFAAEQQLLQLIKSKESLENPVDAESRGEPKRRQTRLHHRGAAIAQQSENYTRICAFNANQAQKAQRLILSAEPSAPAFLVRLVDTLATLHALQDANMPNDSRISEELRQMCLVAHYAYIPIADDLDWRLAKSELGKIIMNHVTPSLRRNLKVELSQLPDAEQFLVPVQEFVLGFLEEEGLADKVTVKFAANNKSPYPAWRKLSTLSIRDGKIYNLDALTDLCRARFILDAIESDNATLENSETQESIDLDQLCVRLGQAVHNRFRGKLFKNYVDQPKENGYQSVHTILDVEGQSIEVQFRTRRMHHNTLFAQSHGLHTIGKTTGHHANASEDRIRGIQELMHGLCRVVHHRPVFRHGETAHL